MALNDKVEAVRVFAFFAELLKWLELNEGSVLSNLEEVLILEVTILDEFETLQNDAQVFYIANRALRNILFHHLIQKRLAKIYRGAPAFLRVNDRVV